MPNLLQAASSTAKLLDGSASAAVLVLAIGYAIARLFLIARSLSILERAAFAETDAPSRRLRALAGLWPGSRRLPPLKRLSVPSTGSDAIVANQHADDSDRAISPVGDRAGHLQR